VSDAADNGSMASKQEVRRIVEGYAQSGMTRRQYCEKHNIRVSTLDYWRHIQKRKPRLVEVAVETQPTVGFVLVLANGRRIESTWRFGEAELMRLIRAAEA
jgi:transposase-like protein